MFESLYGRHYNKRRVKIQLAPANLHWCSDKALRQLSDTSRKYGVPLHMHLLETAYQKEYARRRGGGTAVEYIGRFDLLGPQNWVASPTGRSLVASRASWLVYSDEASGCRGIEVEHLSAG